MSRLVISLNVKAAAPDLGPDGVLVLPVDEIARIAVTDTQVTIRTVSDQRAFVFTKTAELESVLADYFTSLNDAIDVELVELR